MVGVTLLIDIGTLGGNRSIANGINNFGNVVGWSETSSGKYHAYLWTEQLGIVDLGTLGGESSYMKHINDLGQAVGYSDTTLGIRHAFHWDNINGMRDLNDLIPADSGWELIRAEGINNRGEIVGLGHRNGEIYNRVFLLDPVKK